MLQRWNTCINSVINVEMIVQLKRQERSFLIYSNTLFKKIWRVKRITYQLCTFFCCNLRNTVMKWLNMLTTIQLNPNKVLDLSLFAKHSKDQRQNMWNSTSIIKLGSHAEYHQIFYGTTFWSRIGCRWKRFQNFLPAPKKL